jgi:hypothetical protein
MSQFNKQDADHGGLRHDEMHAVRVEAVAASALSIPAGRERPHPKSLTMEDLERRISRLEEDRQQFTAIIQAIHTFNQAVAREFQFFRDAIIEHREEVRGGFADLVTRFERAETRCHALEGYFDGLEAKVDRNHAEVMARLEKLLGKT